MPLGVLVKRSANWRIVLVGFNSPNPNFSFIQYGSKLTLAPKSNKALWIVWSPRTIEMVGQLRSLYLAKIWREIMELTLKAKKAFFRTLVVLLVVHNSFKNLAYGGICWIESRRGMLILIWEKVYLILPTWVWSFLFRSLFRKGAVGLWTSLTVEG